MSIPRSQNVLVSLKDGVALLKYNRPKSNAINVALVKDLLAAVKWAESDERVKVIVQTGEGRFFTAGLDVQDPSVVTPETVISDVFIDTLNELHETMIKSDKVLVTAVNGPAPGWGTSSLALSDLVYATPEAFFFTPFTNLGICAEACSSLTFSRIMGHQKAASLLLAGDRWTAKELESAGLVTKVVPQERFLDQVLETCYRIAASPPDALKLNKQLMMRTARQDLLEVNALELKHLKEKARTREARLAFENFIASQKSKKKTKL